MRKEYLDIASGFFIIQIIVGHILQFCYEWHLMALWVKFFSFYMPFFYFKSGMFANPQKEVRQLVIKDFWKLLYPFFMISLIGWILNLPFDIQRAEVPIYESVLRPWAALLYHGSMPSSLALWYLPSLFLVRFMGQILLRRYNGRNMVMVFVIIYVLGYFCSFIYQYIPLLISTVFPGLFFYLSGYLLRKRIEEPNVKFLFLSILCYSTITLFFDSNVEMRNNSLSEGSYLLWLIKNGAGLYFFLYILNRYSGFKLRILYVIKHIGINSMSYYVFHWLILMLIRNVMRMNNPDYKSYEFVIISICACLILLPIIDYMANRLFPTLIGKSYDRC